MADPSTAESQELVRFPDVPKPPGLDEKEQYAVMLAAAKQRGGLRTGEDLTALPAGTPGPGGAWKSGGTITAASGTVYDVYTRDPAPEPPTPSDTSASTPPGSDALQDVDKNFSPGPPDDTVAKCVTGFAEGFVEGFAVGYAVGFLLGALGPVGAVIGVGLLLYSAYQVVTNWDKIKAAPPEEKARMIGGLAGGILGGGLGARAGTETVADLPPKSPRLPQDEAVDPTAPPAKPTGPIGTSPAQAAELQSDIAEAQADGATDIRVNQQQVNADGDRVGINRPDLQYTDSVGRRNYVEYDAPTSGRGPGHAQRILANDPDGIVTLKTVHEDGTVTTQVIDGRSSVSPLGQAAGGAAAGSSRNSDSAE